MNDLKKQVLIRIVDDDPDVCTSMSFMLQCRGWQVSVYGSAADFLRDDAPSVPGVLLLDIRMPEMSGVELQRHLKEKRIRLPIIFITGHADVDTAVHTLKMGAIDFLKKPVDTQALEASIVEASRLSLAHALGRLPPDAVNLIFEEMSEREKTITKLLIDGYSNKDIAAQFSLSERTVQGHRNNIYHKLRVHNLDELLEQVKGADVALLTGLTG